jgi:two-component system sensor histidine kinase VicK
MQQSLSNALHFFEEAAKQTERVLFAFDVDTQQFLYLNPAVEQLWNKSVEDISTKPEKLLETIHPEDREHLVQTYHKIVSGTERKDVEFRIQLPDNCLKWIVVNPFMVKEESGKRGIVGFAEDISNWKDKEMNMQKFAAKKDSIMEILSHDLAGPLNNIKGIASLLTEKLQGHNDPELDKLVGMVERTSERSIRLIREFVKQEFLQSKNASVAKKRVDMAEEMRDIIEQYKGSESEISKTFHLNISNEPIFIKTDAYKFSQVINNLISNAIKFTKDNGKITLSLEEKQSSVLISVADNGIGIPAKYHDTLFEKFTKARRKGLKGEPSTGLGMSIIKTIVEWHDGKIWFDSKENEGTTFYIELPKELNQE